MKIGLSYSRCLLDIHAGKVDLNNVLVIVSRTDFDVDNDNHWSAIWAGYTSSYSAAGACWNPYIDKEEEFRDLTRTVRDQGKLHQPRQYGGFPSRIHGYHWLDTIVSEEDLDSRPAARKAWENYQLIAGLS